MREKIKKEEEQETILQEPRKIFESKIFNYLGITSVTLGIIGLFIAGLIFGFASLLLGFIAREKKQRFAILGIILGILSVIGWLMSMIISHDISQEILIAVISSAILGGAYSLLRPKSKQEKKQEITPKEKTKTHRSFVQLPLLIVIIVGVLVVGGASYFGVKTKTEQAKPPLVSETQKTLSTAQIVSQNKRFIVSVVCHTGDGSVFGSGIIIGRSQGSLIALTNYHVTKYAETSPKGIPPCVVSDSLGLGEYYYGQPTYYPSMVSQSEYVSLSQQEALMDAIDFSFIEIKEPIQGETMYYDDTTGKYISQPSIPKTSLLSTAVFPKICSQNLLKAGEEMVVLGYPIIGGDSVLPGVPELKLITTEGIISNDVSAFDNYFVSSAKIEQGNSGGGGFLKSGNCLAGMPTYVQVGEIESLGRLINLPKLKQDYLSKVFSNL